MKVFQLFPSLTRKQIVQVYKYVMICYENARVCVCVYHDLVFMYWLYTGPVNMKTCVLTTPFAKLKPHWSHKRHFVVATRPANGKPRNHHRGIVGNLYYTFLIFRHPNIIHLLKWIKYDRIAFRSFCPLSLN